MWNRYYLKEPIIAMELGKLFGAISHRWEWGTGEDNGLRLFYANGELVAKLDNHRCGDIWTSILLDTQGAEIFRQACLLAE